MKRRAFSLRVMAWCTLVAIAGPDSLAAQRVDSTRAGVGAPAATPATAVPSNVPSPRRAFLGSLLLPGSMQMRFDRKKAATIFLLAEAGAGGMSVKSWVDLSRAKKARADTVGTPALNSDGTPQLDPDTGEPVINYAPRNKNLADRVRARRAHLEDWLAIVVFNHLFAGADAYVSANLADFDANVGSGSSQRRVEVRARVAW